MLDKARAKLSSGKATGDDGLPDKWIKNAEVYEAVKHKLLAVFEGWYNGAEIPRWVKQGRVCVLSKEETQYPRQGRIRTITILPAITKLYELVVL